MPLFDIPTTRSSRSSDIALVAKMKQKKAVPTTVKGGGDIASQIAVIKAKVEQYLGKFRDQYLCIQDEDTLRNYVDRAIENGIVSIDTETTGLDPILDELVGIVIYTPDMKPAYIPINHKSYITGQRVKNQLSADVVGREFQRIVDAGIEDIMFNGTFDIRVCRHGINIGLKCTWDCYLGARCLNENEHRNTLKELHAKYVLRGEEEEFTFKELFKKFNFAYIPIETAFLYAAHDGIDTYELYLYQKPFLTPDDPECIKRGLQDIAWVFHNIEMPIVEIVADMEDVGIAFDTEYAQELSVKYHKLLDEKEQAFQTAYHMYDDEIAEYNGNVRFDDPINIQSVPQLQALLYDIIKLDAPIDKKTKKPSRSTGEEVLQKMKDNAVVQAILDYREFSTIVGTFIDKLPECVNPKDGRIHCKFNQYGADTGRFSSQDPNMQNIPSHNKDIRKMFTASPGYVLMSSDFSQQEIKGMAQMCGDEGMIEAFKQGKDFYAQIASVAFGYPYEECLEFRPDGTKSPDGKERRSQAKSILLGINYGRGAASIAEQLHCKREKAEKIKTDVFRGFPAIEKFEKDSFKMAIEKGYVTTLWGRKRRLPDMQLPDFEFVWKAGSSPTDDLLDFDSDSDEPEEVPDHIIKKYLKKLNGTWGERRQSIYEEANAEGIWIIDNTKKKADAQRQCVNARIQGTAADQSKLAMIALHNNARLKELGFRMLVPVHDEIIAECPKENAKEVAELFAYVMSHSGGEKFTIPITCDVEVSERWYGESIEL